MSKYLIVIAGATATGKTALSIALAKKFKTEIISADSRQFYREMNIGTAKPTNEELSQIPHHFINNLSVEDNYSVGQYEKEVITFLNNFYKKNNLAILVGGTGLFISAVCKGLDIFPDVSEAIKLQIEEAYKQNGLEFLQKKLESLDPIYFQTVDKNNPVRLMRALSVIQSTGKPFSEFQTGEKVARDFIPIYICLDIPRGVLYNRINHRVDVMVSNGLIEEVQNLLPHKNLQALQTVGYSELFDYFENKTTYEAAIDKIKQHSRNYAKRQITWFKKDAHWKYFSPDEFENIVTYICGWLIG